MRILITNTGEATVKELEEMNVKFNYKTTTDKNKFRKRKSSLDLDNSFIEKNKKTKQDFYHTYRPNTKFIDVERRTLTKEEIRKNAISVKINTKKLVFPKHIAEQYENETEEDGTIRKTIIMQNNSLPCITMPNKNLNDKKDDRGDKLAIGQILTSSTVYKIKKKMCFEKKMSDKLAKIDETKFRSTYQLITDLEKLDQILKYRKIPLSKMNLINYLNNKEEISNCSIRRLIASTDDEISKTNKICQMVFHNEAQNKVLKEIIKAKINHNHISERITCESNIQEMKKDIDSFKSSMSKYERKINKMEKYREAHSDLIKKYWNKYNFEGLRKKKELVNGKFVTNQKIIVEDI